MGESRFSDDWVARNYEIVNMGGPKGGGFVFDTNALHKGLMRGSATRTVIILEFHAHGKIGPLLPHRCPCPSAKREMPVTQWIDGLAGYPLYPQEKLWSKLDRRARAHLIAVYRGLGLRPPREHNASSPRELKHEMS